MIRSKELVVSELLASLLRSDNNCEKKELLSNLHSIISYSDLKGIEIYLHLEELLSKSPYSDKKMFNILREIFINELIPQKSIMPYETWQHFSRVIYCLEPLLYSYALEREFFGNWHPEHNKWVFNF